MGADDLGQHIRRWARRALQGTEHAARITQLRGDSRTYDFSDFLGRIDLVVVDAGHSYECAHSDTENALKMLSPLGAVVWDDDGSPGVVRAVDEGAERYELSAVRLVPTELVVYERAAAIAPSPPWATARDAEG